MNQIAGIVNRMDTGEMFRYTLSSVYAGGGITLMVIFAYCAEVPFFGVEVHTLFKSSPPTEIKAFALDLLAIFLIPFGYFLNTLFL